MPAQDAAEIRRSAPVNWTTGHVELARARLLVIADNCVCVMPTPTFSYEITAP